MSACSERDQVERMIGEGNPNTQPQNYYEHECLVPGSRWRLINAKLPLLGIPFNPSDPTTYKRMAFQPFTGEHQLFTEAEVSEMRAKAKGE